MPGVPAAKILAIGASTGGPKSLAVVLGALPADLPAAVVVIQHMDPSFFTDLPGWLGAHTPLRVTGAASGDVLKQGVVYVAQSPNHLILTPRRTLDYTDQPDTPYRPSVDAFFLSLARYAPWPGVAALLTGMGRDGAAGLLALRKAGWETIAQDQATSAMYGMPKAAVELGAAKMTLPLDAIAAAAMRKLKQP